MYVQVEPPVHWPKSKSTGGKERKTKERQNKMKKKISKCIKRKG